MANYGKICDDCEYGRHITLTCKNHTDKRWSTKNIGGIGHRTIFFVGPVPECECPVSDLYHIHPESKS